MSSATENENNRRLVTLVVGMHRSGTSVVTRGLLSLGISLGDRVSTAPAEDNRKGHWEDQDVKALNDRLLESMDMQWDATAPIDFELRDAPSFKPVSDEIRNLTSERLFRYGTWAFKDPRTAKVLPFWLDALEKSDCYTRIVWIVRNPISVARSLQRRNGFSQVKSDLLWLAHNLPIIDWVKGLPVVVLDYDQLLADARGEMLRVASALGITSPDVESLEEFADQFIDSDLNHTRDPDTLSVPAFGVRLLAMQAYQLLCHAAEGRLELNRLSENQDWVALRQEYQLYTPVYRYVDSMTRSGIDGGDRLIQGFEGLHQAKEVFWGKQVSDRDNQIETLLDQLTATEKDLTRVRQSFEESVFTRQRLETKLEAHENDNRELIRSVDQIARVIDRQARTLDQSDAEAARLREEGNSTKNKLNVLQTQLQSSNVQLGEALALLNQERYTVLRPLLRKSYRTSASIASRLPAPIWNLMRRAKRRFIPQTINLSLTNPFEAVGPQTDAADAFLPSMRAAKQDTYDLIVFPVIDWHFRFQRPQHLAKQMAELNHRVIYLATTFMPTQDPSFRIVESPADNVWLIQLGIPEPHPRIYEDALTSQQVRHIGAALRKMTLTCELDRVVSMIDLPFWRIPAQSIPGNLIVYDCMDYHGGFSTNSTAMLEEEDRLLNQADIVLTTSSRLSDMVAPSARNTVIRNAGEIEYFSSEPTSLAYPSQQPVVGYLGAISEWFDIELVAQAARRFPDWSFVLVGSTHMCDTTPVRRLANVELIGEVPYQEAASWVHSFDVALIPFKITELTMCTNPVKAYEYLAAGKPIVSTDLPEVRLMDGMVHVAADRSEFLELLQIAMSEVDDEALSAERREWSMQHDWSARAANLSQVIDNFYPKVSVVVLTYNNLDFTRACLSSLEAHTDYPNWELIVVDNGSSDGTPEYLLDYAESRRGVRVIINEENLGFSAGNNIGLKAADGDFLIVLNNDTFVTRGWMLDLVRHLQKDPQLGLIGPVTNNIGNEAKIDIHYSNMKEMADAAFKYTSTRSGEVLDTRVVAFFCTAMSREVYELIGGLDEAFGRGFFEDDDYCNRVRKEGLKVGIAEDVFIHHHLSGSFGKLDDSTRNQLFERNKAIYEEKWGEWVPHQYRA